MLVKRISRLPDVPALGEFLLDHHFLLSPMESYRLQATTF